MKPSFNLVDIIVLTRGNKRHKIIARTTIFTFPARELVESTDYACRRYVQKIEIRYSR